MIIVLITDEKTFLINDFGEIYNVQNYRVKKKMLFHTENNKTFIYLPIFLFKIVAIRKILNIHEDLLLILWIKKLLSKILFLLIINYKRCELKTNR